MERVVKLQIEKLPEDLYLATSDDMQGLVAQGRTILETLEIARDVARRLLEAMAERDEIADVPEVDTLTDYPLIVGL